MEISTTPRLSAAGTTPPPIEDIAVIRFGRSIMGVNRYESIDLDLSGRRPNGGENIDARFLGKLVPVKIKESTWSRQQVDGIKAALHQAVEGAGFHGQASIDRYFDDNQPGVTTIAIGFEGEEGPRVMQARSKDLPPTMQAIVDAVRAARITMGEPTPKPG